MTAEKHKKEKNLNAPAILVYISCPPRSPMEILARRRRDGASRPNISARGECIA
jgi:hypothetical protein